MLKAFVSSTFEDLLAHRQAAAETLRHLGFSSIDVMDTRQKDFLETSLNILAQADLFIGIYASYYGQLLPQEGISLTEKLYNSAAERRLPRFIYVVAPGEDWALAYLQTAPQGALMRMFLDRLYAENPHLRHFTSPADLADKMAFDLGRFKQQQRQRRPLNKRHLLWGVLLVGGVLAVGLRLLLGN